MLTTGLAFAVLGVAGCATQPLAEPVPSRTARPTPTPTPTPTRSETSTRPAPKTSFGPNGTHYPADTPWPGEVAAHEVDADCTWSAIGDALAALTSAQVAEGAVIRVAPGTLPGAGATSSSEPALAGAGSAEWSRNVLICPRDGFGTVTVADDGFRLDACHRLSLFGLLSEGSFALTECASIEIGFSRLSGANITRGGQNLALYELMLGFRQNPDDTVGVRPTDSNAMTDIARYGCVFGPSVKPADSGAHCDTLQLEGTGDGEFGPLLSVDCVDYGSSNAAMLLHTQLIRAEFRHCMVLAERLPWRVYPLSPGDYEGEPNAFSGGCLDVRMTDSVVAGPIGRMGFTEVTNSTLSYAPQAVQQPSVSGQWGVDTAIAQWSAAQIMQPQTLDDYEIASLARLWQW